MQGIPYRYAVFSFGPSIHYYDTRDSLDDIRELALYRAKESGVLNVAIVDSHRKIIDMIKGSDIETIRGKVREQLGMASCKKGKVVKEREAK
jgi:hypothetical protein